ncbi:MAG: putative ABC transporter permease protein YesP [Chloroflexota bacterium]|nr:MAG: putative ABC transporter permease protein YesP [Chloroflexota bacterium]
MTAAHWYQRFLPRTLAGRRTLIGYIFISPFILGFLLWFIIPAGVALWLTVHDWNLISPPKYVGAKHLVTMWEDDRFWKSLSVTTTYTLVSVPVGLVLGFGLALLLNTKVRGISFFRTAYYLPSIVPAVANAVLWAWIFNTEFGLANAALRFFGLPKIAWLQRPEWALPALILVALWGFGSGMVIYLAGLQGIPDVFYEAAEIDGAGRVAKLRHITIPLVSPVIFFNLIIGIIASFQVFTIARLVTNGGPQNATLVYVLYMYQNAFQNLKMGYAAALAWVLFFIVVALTLFVFKYVGSRVHYEDAQ